MEFKQVWDNIKRHENEEFVTKRGLVLTYELFGDSIKPSRTDYFISKRSLPFVEGPLTFMPY